MSDRAVLILGAFDNGNRTADGGFFPRFISADSSPSAVPPHPVG